MIGGSLRGMWQWSSLAGFGGYKQKPDPTAGYPGYPMGPMSILGIPSRAEAFGTSISRIVCTNKLSDFQGEGMKMLNCLIYLDGREASFLLQGLEVCRAKSRAVAVVNAAESFSYSSPSCQITEDLVNALVVMMLFPSELAALVYNLRRTSFIRGSNIGRGSKSGLARSRIS